MVHSARWVSPIVQKSIAARNRLMMEMLYADDPFWHDSTMRAFDPRTVAWIDHDLETELAPYLSGIPPRATEIVTVTYPTPQRTELQATLEAPGLVILSDADYPGWELTIDGRPAPIYRVNRLMCGGRITRNSSTCLHVQAAILSDRRSPVDRRLGGPGPAHDRVCLETGRPRRGGASGVRPQGQQIVDPDLPA